MASSITLITTTKNIATCGAILLSGPVKIVAEGMVDADIVYIYEETATEGHYQRVSNSINQGQTIVLTKHLQSTIFEGYGNYKFLLGEDTAADLKVGYAS